MSAPPNIRTQACHGNGHWAKASPHRSFGRLGCELPESSPSRAEGPEGDNFTPAGFGQTTAIGVAYS